MYRNLIRLKTQMHPDSRSNRFQRLKIQPIILIFMVSIASLVRAEPYEVLVVDIAGANDIARIEEFKKDAEKFNSLQRRGYSNARPYFNVLYMANGQAYFVFGFRDQVQGIHRRHYPATIKNLRRMQHKGTPKYPRMHWLPVAEIRLLLNKP